MPPAVGDEDTAVLAEDGRLTWHQCEKQFQRGRGSATLSVPRAAKKEILARMWAERRPDCESVVQEDIFMVSHTFCAGERNRMRRDDMPDFAGLAGPSPGKDSP